MIPLRDNVPTRTAPVVTLGLIAANALVWFWELSRPGVDVHVFRDGFYPCSVQGPCAAGVHALPWWEGVFTGMFMHASWEHILGNMLFLWIFGNNVEDALGRVRFLAWYLAAGIAAMAAQTAVTLSFAGVSAASIPNIGASGAIAGVLGAYFVLLPRARVLTLIFFGIILIREIHAFWFLLVWIGLQIWTGGLSLLHPEAGGGVAFFAHIGGFAFGLATVLLVARRRPREPEPRYPVWWRVRFETHVERAIASLPPELREAVRNVEISVEDEHPDDPDLFGLYEGVPLPERGDWAGSLPDRIRIFRLPLVESFPDPDELEREIRITVLHEPAHYFGLDEDRLDDLGYS